MSQLSIDLNRDWKQLRRSASKGEILKGMAILSTIAAELAGIVAIAAAAIKVATVLTGGIAALGIPITMGAIMPIVSREAQKIGMRYENLSRENRKAVRAAIAFLGIPANIFD